MTSELSKSTAIQDKEFQTKALPVPSEDGQGLAGTLLPLVDSEYKKFAVDIYNVQLANCRNYMWLFFIVLSASLAFFKESELGPMLLDFIYGYPVSAFFLLALLTFGCTLICALLGFWIGVSISTGTKFVDAYEKLQDRLTDVELAEFNKSDIYSLKRDLLDGLCIALQNGIKQMERRGEKLAQLSWLFKGAVISFLLTLIFYGGTYIR